MALAQIETGLKHLHDQAIEAEHVVVEGMKSWVEFAGQKFHLSARKSNLEGKNVRLASAAFPPTSLLNLPETLDYRHEMLPVRDQGDKPICVAITGATIKEWQTYKDSGKPLELFSADFIYERRCNPSEDGMYGQNLMDILKTAGCPTQKSYDALRASRGDKTVYGQVMADAKQHCICDSALVDTVDSLKAALYKNGPCAIIVPCYNSSTRLWRPQTPTEQCLGGHCLAVVGFTKEGFILRNSWTASYGQQGYTVFPFSDWGMQWEAWTTVDANSHVPAACKIPTSQTKCSCVIV